MTLPRPALGCPAAALTTRTGGILPLLGMLFSVILILVLAYLATRWIAKRGSPAASGFSVSGSGDERFRVLRLMSLGRDERLALVRLGERCLLLGVTSGSIVLLRELTEEESAAWLVEDETPAPPSFWEAVQKNLPKRK